MVGGSIKAKAGRLGILSLMNTGKARLPALHPKVAIHMCISFIAAPSLRRPSSRALLAQWALHLV